MKAFRKNINLEKDEISISRFVNEYLGINADCSNLYHKGLKSFGSPLIIGVSNDTSSKCPDLIANGTLLKVRDSRGHLGTYINPDIIARYAESVENREKYESVLKTLRIREFNRLQELYSQSDELEATLKQIDDYMDMITTITKTEQEERVKRKEIRKSAEVLIKIKKIK